MLAGRVIHCLAHGCNSSRGRPAFQTRSATSGWRSGPPLRFGYSIARVRFSSVAAARGSRAREIAHEFDNDVSANAPRDYRALTLYFFRISRTRSSGSASAVPLFDVTVVAMKSEL